MHTVCILSSDSMIYDFYLAKTGSLSQMIVSGPVVRTLGLPQVCWMVKQFKLIQTNMWSSQRELSPSPEISCILWKPSIHSLHMT